MQGNAEVFQGTRRNEWVLQSLSSARTLQRPKSCLCHQQSTTPCRLFKCSSKYKLV